MWNWIYDNRDWIFSGIGVAVLTLVISIAKSKSGFKLTFRFYTLLFISFVLGFGADYFFNTNGDWRFRIFIFGSSIIGVFVIDWLIAYFFKKIAVRKTVLKLSIEDCRFVEKCYKQDEYIKMDMVGYPSFINKWGNILYVPTAAQIELNRNYKICVYEYAYKLVKKRLRGKRF